MILTIWRHGEAESGAVDRQRKLTASGREDIGFGCHRFHRACADRLLAPPTHIFYSPWQRTVQTAEIVASAFTHALAEEADWLAPDSTVTRVNQTLSRDFESIERDCHVALVSHQPLVSRVVDWYIGDRGSAVPPLSPGGLVSINGDVLAASCGRLLFWSMPPEFEVGI